jgi:hypothetical protein
MKICAPSFAGSAVWAIYFFVFAVTVVFVGVVASWHTVAGIGLLLPAVAMVMLGGRWVVAAVGFVDTEFVIGLLFGCAIALAGAGMAGKLHKSHSLEHKGPQAHASVS